MAQTDIERKHLKQYQEDSAKQLEQRQILSEQEAQLEALQSEQTPDMKRIRELKGEIVRTQNRIELYGNKLRREETGVYLKNLIRREMKGALARAVEAYGAISPGMNAAEDRTVQADSGFRMLAYEDTAAQMAEMKALHEKMVEQKDIVVLPDEDGRVDQFYPDLRSVKKKDRTPVLRESMRLLKDNIRGFLKSLKSNTYQFSVNGNVLEAKLYDTGIREVSEKISKEKAYMLYSSEEIFANARYLYSLPDYDGNPDIYRWNYFYTPVQIGEEIVGVRIAIRDMVEANESQIYNWGIKKDPSLGGDKRGNIPNPVDASFDELNHTMPQNKQIVKSEDTSSVGAAPSGFDLVGTRLSDAVDKYGAIPAGEFAATDRYVEMPKSMDGKTRVMATMRTMAESSSIPKERVPLIEKAVVDGLASYHQESNSELTAKAREAIMRKGWDAALVDYRKAVLDGESNNEMAAKGALLLQHFMNDDKSSSEDLLELITLYAEERHTAGKSLQASRILKALSPEGKILSMQKTVRHMNDDIHKNNKNSDVDIQIDPKLLDEYRSAKGDTERNAAIEKIQQNVADQIPSTFLDKWTALRYTNMLGNFKTQVRNLLGNTTMGLMHVVKNRVAGGIEDVSAALAKVFGKEMQRSRSFLVSRALYKAAYQDVKNVSDVLLGDAKYQEDTNIEKAINEKRKIFKVNGTWGKTEDSIIPAKLARRAADGAMFAMEKYRRGTNYVMEKGDFFFSKFHYAEALAMYLKTHGVSAEQLSSGNIAPALLDEARQFAINEAQEATFHGENRFSRFATKFDRNWESARIFSRGLLAFRKTPANVFVASEQYSPLGVLNTAANIIKATQKGNDTNASDVINSLAKTLTGSGLFLLGMAWFAKGILSAGGGDDDEQNRFNNLVGKQQYSINIGGKSYDLSWLSPASIPLFMGANFQAAGEENGFTPEALWEAAMQIADPMLNMSMLQGVNDTLENIKYSDNALLDLFLDLSVSYLSQGLTNSLLGQVERTSEDNRTYTYVDKNSWIPDNVQRILGDISKKIPGWDYHQTEYVNAMGQKESNGAWYARVLNNFFSPTYYSEFVDEPWAAEVQRLYKNTGESVVFPKLPDKYIMVAKYNNEGEKISSEKVNLTAEQFDLYATTTGTLAIEMLGTLLTSGAYESLSDEARVDAIENIYKLSKEYGKVAADVGYDATRGTYKKLFGLTEAGVPIAEAYAAKLYHDELDEDRNLTMNQAMATFANWVANKPWTDEQKQAVRDTYGKFGIYMFGDTEKYDALEGISGVSSDTALQITERIAALEPEDGYTTVRPVQKWETVVSMSGMSETQKGEALKQYMTTDKQRTGLAKCMVAGITTAQYVQITRAKDTFGNANGSWSRGELEEYLDKSSYSWKQKEAIREAFLSQ